MCSYWISVSYTHVFSSYIQTKYKHICIYLKSHMWFISCICMYVYICVCIAYMCMYVQNVYICSYLFVCAYIACICMYLCWHPQAAVCVCICMYMYVSTCICLYYMYVHASACIGMYLAVYVCICMYELVCIFWRWLKVPPKIQSSWRLQGGKFSVQKEIETGIKCLWQSWSLNTCLPSHMSLYLPLSHCGFIQIWSNVVLL
jgi:hypothetical protein